MVAINDSANRDLDVGTSRAMVRHQKVAERAGSLVTERVRGVIEAAQVRAETVRRDAAEEGRRLDRQRLQAASRIASEIEDLEAALRRLRREMQSAYTVEGSYEEEGRLIEAAGEEDAPPSDESESAAAAAAPEEEALPEAEVIEADDAGQPTPDTPSEPEDPGASRPAEEAQRTRFSFLRRKERQAEADALADPEYKESDREREEHTYACAVCGRAFAGDEQELKLLGWRISDSGDVTCADCHGAGWLQPTG